MEKIWLKNYPKGVPQDINPDKYSSLLEVFNESFKAYGPNCAFTNFGVELDYNTLDKLSDHFAAYLQTAMGLTKNQTLALMMPNVLQYPIALIGGFKAGLTIVNVNPQYTERELLHQLQDSKASAIVVLGNFTQALQAIIAQTSIKQVVLAELQDLLPWPKSLFMKVYSRYWMKWVPKWLNPTSILSFPDALRIGANSELKRVNTKPHDIAFIQYTGGTTGISKGAMLTHRNMIANLEQARAWIGPVLEQGKETVITALPMYHIFSLTANFFVFMILGAKNVLITNPKDIKSFVNILRKNPFNVITGVNTLFNALLLNEKFKTLPFSQVKFGLGGGMAIQKVVAARWQTVTDSPLLEAYGLTEASPAVCINPLNLTEFNDSIGLPISSTEISIRDLNDEELGIDTPGELWVRGPQVMSGYYNQAQETAMVLTADKWLKTGDIAEINAEGFLKIVDRKKDMILVSGFNVYPNELEDVITEMPEVKEAAVVGVPHPINGELVKAYVVKASATLTNAEVIAYCKLHLTTYKIPKIVVFVDELPKNNIGKILRKVLREKQD